MAIVNDRAGKRVVDTETGEYMNFALYDRESNQWFFNIQDKDGRPIFGSIVKKSAVGEHPETGGATHVKFSVKKCWFPSGKPEAPSYFWGQTDWIERLSQFLAVYKYYYGIKSPDPLFSFEDARIAPGDAG